MKIKYSWFQIPLTLSHKVDAASCYNWEYLCLAKNTYHHQSVSCYTCEYLWITKENVRTHLAASSVQCSPTPAPTPCSLSMTITRYWATIVSLITHQHYHKKLVTDLSGDILQTNIDIFYILVWCFTFGTP